MKSRIIKPALTYFMSFSRLTRIKVYITHLESIYKPSSKKIKKVSPIKEYIDRTILKASIAAWGRNFFNLILYASVITALSSVLSGIDLSFLSKQLKWVSSIIGGTTVALIGASITSRLINLYLVDLMLAASTIIAVYTSPEDDIDKIEVFKAMKRTKYGRL